MDSKAKEALWDKCLDIADDMSCAMEDVGDERLEDALSYLDNARLAVQQAVVMAENLLEE